MTEYKLHCWSACEYTDPYLAPELRQTRLVGRREGEDKIVRTSRVVDVAGRRITTRHNVYILCDIDPDYLAWLDDNGYDYDPDNPIKVKL